jgi:hypothetical protein
VNHAWKAARGQPRPARGRPGRARCREPIKRLERLERVEPSSAGGQEGGRLVTSFCGVLTSSCQRCAGSGGTSSRPAITETGSLYLACRQRRLVALSRGPRTPRFVPVSTEQTTEHQRNGFRRTGLMGGPAAHRAQQVHRLLAARPRQKPVFSRLLRAFQFLEGEVPGPTGRPHWYESMRDR